MSEDISDKIDNDEWIENEIVSFECPDGVKRQFECESQNGYAQFCGGWEHSETGQIYGIASWGKRMWLQNRIDETVTKDNILGAESTDGVIALEVDVITSPLKHELQTQMHWWFEQKDIDITKLVPISFRWNNPYAYNGNYTLENGPLQGQKVCEPIPACIPRGYYAGIEDKEYILGNAIEVITDKKYVDIQDVSEIVMIPSGGN